MPGFDVKFPNGATAHVDAEDAESAERAASLNFGAPATVVKKRAPKKAAKKSTAKKAGAKATAKKPEASGGNTPSQQPTRDSNTKPGTTTPDVTGS